MTKRRSDGDGSLYQVHKPGCQRPQRGCDCRWRGAIVLGYRDGKPIRKVVSAATKSGAATNLRELRDKVNAGTIPTDRTPTVTEWMTYWVGQVAPRRIRPLTLEGYQSKVTQYIIPLLGHHRLDQLTPEHIETAWDHLANVGNPTLDHPVPLSANTVHQVHRILARALRVAVQRRKLTTNPAGADSMDAPPLEVQEIVPMTQEEVTAVLAAAEGGWNAARWHVALALGLRQGEALGLRWEDVDLDQRILHVRQTLQRHHGKGLVYGVPKSRNSRRALPIPGQLLDDLKAHRREQLAARLAAGSFWTDTGLVFTLIDGRPIDPSVDSKRWRGLLAAAGVKPYRLHDARHSAATIMVSKGVDIRVAMKILGHSQIQVTMRYQHAVDALMVDAAARIDEAFRR